MEKNGRSDNSAICGGLAASQEAEALRKEFHIDSLGSATIPADPPTALEDCRKLCRCCVGLHALYLALGLKPIVPVVAVCPSALLVKFVGALLNLLLNRNKDGRLVRLRREC